MIKDKLIGKVLGFKLSSGEEILGKVVTEEGEDFVLDSPHKTVMTPQGPVILPFLVMPNERCEVVIKGSSVVSTFLPREDYVNTYNQFIDPTPEIFMPPAKKLIV